MKYPTSFFIFTLALMLITGVFICVTRYDEAPMMAHVPDPDWSRPHAVTPSLQTIYSEQFAVDVKGRAFSFWGALNPENNRPELQYQIITSTGKVKQKPATLLHSVGSWEFAVTIQNERIHLFWLALGTGPKLDLHYTQFDLDGTLREDTALLTDFFIKPSEMRVAGAPGGQMMLTWLDQESDRVQGFHNLHTLFIRKDGTADQPYEVASRETDNYLPNLVADAKGRFHLAWIQETTGQSLLFTVRKIYYQEFSPEGVVTGEPVFIDETMPDRVGLAVKDDTVYFAWNKILYVTQKQSKKPSDLVFDNYVIYGRTLDRNHPNGLTQVKRLTPEVGPFFDQHLVVDAKGQLELVCVGLYGNFTALSHMVLDENLETVKPLKRIYPEQRLNHLGVTASIFPDAGKGLHFFWEDGESRGKMYYYYANTRRHGHVSPLQVIGLNTNNLIVSSVVSLGYTFIMPFVNIIFGLIIFALFFMGICWRGVAEACRRIGFEWPLKNPYIGPAITVLGVLFFYAKIGMWNSFFRTYQPTAMDTIYLMVTATVACAVYLRLNKTKEGTLTVCIATATLWVFWVNMMSQVFALPGWNFFMSV